MHHDLVLLDLDGTLTDPQEGITASYRYALAAAGRPIADDVDLSWVIGPPIMDNLDALGVPASEAATVVDAYRERHVAVGLYQAVLIPGIADLLAELQQAGVRLALATAKPESQGRETLRHFGLAGLFDVIGGAPGGASTTKGAVVANVLMRCAPLDPHRTVMVGDRRHDIEGAHENGLAAVGVEWGFAAQGELEAAGADTVVATVDHLRAFLLG